MAAHGVSDSDGGAQVEKACDFRQVAAKSAPGVRRVGLGAAAVPAQVHRNGAAAGQAADHRVPTARVEARGMGEEQRRVLARPLPDGEIDALNRDDTENGFGHTKL